MTLLNITQLLLVGSKQIKNAAISIILLLT